MTKDKKVLYIISFITFAVLLLAFFINVENSKILTVCLLLPLTVLTLVTIKKRGSLSIHKKEALMISVMIGTIYVVLIQMSGIFFGYYHNPYMVTPKTFFNTVLPIAAIIVGTELIRRVLVAQKNSFVSIIAYLSCVVAEALTCSNLGGISNLNRFMDFFGLTLFPAICANIYYHYASKLYGALPNIAFRFIITLYVYFFKNTTAMSDAMLSMTKLLLPIIMLTFMSALFAKRQKNAKKKTNKLSAAGIVFASVVIVSIVMLISCQFRFGAIVIATESMTGEINKGDMIIYERYEDQTITEGQVIVFLQGQNKIVHRVIKIERIEGETRYYTKGDANQSMDDGYVTETDIVGLTDMKVAYVGYPTLWLHEILKPKT